jgi:exodeoxyribonuclease-3
MIRIASWNVNSIKSRLDNALTWLRAAQPDVLCLQEIKCVDEAFPKDAFADMGYNAAVHGQKTYNGVAILSKWPIDEAVRGLPGGGGRGKDKEDDGEARYLEAVISLDGSALRVASIYAPNGNPVDSDKYPYKLGWMARLKAHAAGLLRLEEPLALAGDYNVIPEPEDVYDPEAWAEDALFRMETRRTFRALLNLGLTDALRACDGASHRYTFWDYQGGAWQKDRGLRIDHILLSPQAAARLKGCEIDRTPRSWEKPSDHTPIVAELAL